VSWVETDSLSFTARHEEADAAFAKRTLDRLEDLRLKLEDRFNLVPDDITVVIHDNPAWLAAAHPLLPAVRAAATSAGRRYLAGWPMATELHVLNEPWIEQRAGGEDSERALRGTADRLYVQLVLAANNELLPPVWTPRRFLRYLRWAWMIEGGAQYFSGQVPLFRAAVLNRLRGGRKPSFPPSRRDAIILGGTVFDLLEQERGTAACELIVQRLRRGGPGASLELAFEAPLRRIESEWRVYLEELVSPGAGEIGASLTELDARLETGSTSLEVDAPDWLDSGGESVEDPDHERRQRRRR
jgi:hypothetical protein